MKIFVHMPCTFNALYGCLRTFLNSAENIFNLFPLLSLVTRSIRYHLRLLLATITTSEGTLNEATDDELFRGEDKTPEEKKKSEDEDENFLNFFIFVALLRENNCAGGKILCFLFLRLIFPHFFHFVFCNSFFFF